MDEKRARLILESYRPGVDDPGDPPVAEALQEVAANPGLAEWFAEEQAFDRAIAAHLEAVPAPFGLKTRILASAEAPSTSRLCALGHRLGRRGGVVFPPVAGGGCLAPRRARVDRVARLCE